MPNNSQETPSAFNQAVSQFSSLPGIGYKTAQRLVIKLLSKPKNEIIEFSKAFDNLANNINKCSQCYNITESEICNICLDNKRNPNIICVVEHALDLIKIENSKTYKGLYHILGGIISPIDGITPSSLKIKELTSRIKTITSVKEIILALSTTIEGDATNYYIYKQFKNTNIKISTIARGVGIGNELEYTDEITLSNSIKNRLLFESTITQN